MIPATPLPPSPEPAAWQQALQDCVSDPPELLALPGPRARNGVETGASRGGAAFRCACRAATWRACAAATRTTRCCARCCRCDAETARDPGLRAPTRCGDLQALRATGLLHKYHGRALLVTTGACAVHCRYCFRREFPYGEQHAGTRGGWQPHSQSIRADSSVTK